MGKSLLKDLLMNHESFEPDDMLYIAEDTRLSLDTHVNVLPSDPLRPARLPGQRYFLGVEQVRAAIEAAEIALNRSTTLKERFAAVRHFAENDAFIAEEDLLQAES